MPDPPLLSQRMMAAKLHRNRQGNHKGIGMSHKHLLFRSEAAAERAGEAVGDGTTTLTLLAHAVVGDGMRNIAAGQAVRRS